MKTIFADYNAMTEKEHVRLTCRGSEADLRKTELGVGDWTWLSDSEVLVGAQLEMDSYYGLVAVPDWETLVHLDDETDRDTDRLAAEFQELSKKQQRSSEEEARIFQILTLLETFALPAERTAIPPGYFALRRAGALREMGKLELALVEADEAVRQAPDNPNTKFFYLDLLGKLDLARAILEAKAETENDRADATVLAACLNIWAIGSERVSNEQFRTIAVHILEWADRFEQAANRRNVADSVTALVYFNRGMVLLRMGRADDARQWLERAHQLAPSDETYKEATQLERHDERARQLVSQVHSRGPAPVPVAA